MRFPRLLGPLLPRPLGVLTVLAVPVLVAGLLHLALSIYGPALAHPEARVIDFSYYYDPAARVLDEPEVLYREALGREGTGFAYPPPAIVFFLPFTLLPMPVAFLLMALGIVVCTVAAVLLALRLYEGGVGERVPTGLQGTLVLVTLATAPVLQNLRFGQVNVFVLVLGLLFLHLLARDRPLAAAVVLSLGFWLKLYPLALAPLGLGRGRTPRLVTGFALGLVGLPLVLLPLLPPHLYAEFFLDLFPAKGSTTQADALNQALPIVFERLLHPAEVFFQHDPIPLHPVVKGLATVSVLGFFGGLALAYLTGRLRREVAGVAMLAMLPVASVLGWEHTYALALPLVLFAVLLAQRRGRGARWLTGAGLFVLMVPKPPRAVMEAILAEAPRSLSDLLYARFLFVVLALTAATVVWTWRRGRVEPAPVEAP